jgi:hypothetical protein
MFFPRFSEMFKVYDETKAQYFLLMETNIKAKFGVQSYTSESMPTNLLSVNQKESSNLLQEKKREGYGPRFP